MKPRIRLTDYAVVIFAVTMCAAISTSNAADRFMRLDTGQPRELINQPGCCTLEDYAGSRRCDIGDQ